MEGEEEKQEGWREEGGGCSRLGGEEIIRIKRDQGKSDRCSMIGIKRDQGK